ncbi:MAG: lauroyl acyltransferase [Tistlia sp.]
MAVRNRDKFLTKYLRYPLEAALAFLFLGLFKILPLDRASALGGWLGRSVGPRLALSKRAYRNLELVFPEMPQARRREIVRAMWDNLGRTAAEYPHLDRISDPAEGRVEILGAELVKGPAAEGRPVIVAGMHQANFEVSVVTAGAQGIPMVGISRGANNPLVQKVAERMRGVTPGKRVPKGAQGARALMAELQKGSVIGVLNDQKFNEGFEARFLGLPAMTADGPAQLALRFKCPIVPSRLERLGGARFRMTIEPQPDFEATGNKRAEAQALTQAINDRFEAWVRERPEDWLWLHRRFPKRFYR